MNRDPGVHPEVWRTQYPTGKPIYYATEERALRGPTNGAVEAAVPLYRLRPDQCIVDVEQAAASVWERLSEYVYYDEALVTDAVRAALKAQGQ